VETVSSVPVSLKLPPLGSTSTKRKATAKCCGLFQSVYSVIVKLLLLVSGPVGVVTTTGPVVAPVGTVAVM